MSSSSVPTRKEKCQFIWWNLLTTPAELPASMLYKEWQQTAKCDQFHDMSDLRSKMKRRITSKVDERIRSLDFTKTDELRAIDVMSYFRRDQRIELLKALNWRNWIYFHTVDRLERFFIDLRR